MGVLIDDREDALLARYLVQQGLDVSHARLDSGDLCFEGLGPRSSPVLIGFERKRLSDLVNSMTSRRLSGFQLVKMRRDYDYVYLVIEDCWRQDPESNAIQILHGREWVTYPHTKITYRQIDGYLSTLELLCGVIVLRTTSTRETASVYASRYFGWQKPWSDHRSHDTIYAPAPGEYQPRGRASFDMRQPGYIEKIAYQLPGIDAKAWDVARRFPSVLDMITASELEWQSIPGIGPITSHRVYHAIHDRR